MQSIWNKLKAAAGHPLADDLGDRQSTIHDDIRELVKADIGATKPSPGGLSALLELAYVEIQDGVEGAVEAATLVVDSASLNIAVLESSHLNDLSAVSGMLFWLTNDEERLDSALAFARSSVDRSPRDGEHHLTHLNSLAIWLAEASRQSGSPSELRDAVDIGKQIVGEALDRADPAISLWRYNLGRNLAKLYDFTGSESDLNASIVELRGAMASSRDQEEASGYAIGLSETLMKSVRLTSDRHELIEAIETARVALAGAEIELDLLNASANLASVLVEAFEATGAVSYVDEALDLLGSVGGMAFPPDIVAEVRGAAYHAHNDAASLSAAIEAARQALAANAVADSQQRFAAEANLAVYLEQRYLLDRHGPDLDEALTLAQSAAQFGQNGPDRATLLHRVASLLEERSIRDDSWSDLDLAIELMVDVVKAAPPELHYKAALLNYLSRLRLRKYESSGIDIDFGDALGALRDWVECLAPSSDTQNFSGQIGNGLKLIDAFVALDRPPWQMIAEASTRLLAFADDQARAGSITARRADISLNDTHRARSTLDGLLAVAVHANVRVGELARAILAAETASIGALSSLGLSTLRKPPQTIEDLSEDNSSFVWLVPTATTGYALSLEADAEGGARADVTELPGFVAETVRRWRKSLHVDAREARSIRTRGRARSIPPTQAAIANVIAEMASIVAPAFERCLQSEHAGKNVWLLPTGEARLLPWQAKPQYRVNLAARLCHGEMHRRDSAPYSYPFGLFDPDETLPGARTEGEFLKQLANDSTQLLFGPEATLEAVLAASAPSMVHIATHGVDETGLVLAGGTLTAGDAVQLGNWWASAHHVLVNACGSGMVEADLWDEALSLAAVALVAGVPSATITLWPIDDADACDWAIRWHDANSRMVDPFLAHVEASNASRADVSAAYLTYG
ncbi:MAG: CHAT domain-containing protein [Actinomycetota bacterium]